MQDLVLECICSPLGEGTGGSCRLVLTNNTAQPLKSFRLALSGPARIGSKSPPEGAQVLRQLSNYTELAPESGFTLEAGASWTIMLAAGDYAIRHWTDGPTAAFLIRSDGTATPVLTLPPRLSAPAGARLRGTMTLGGEPSPEAPISLTPWPRTVEVSGRRSVPAGLALITGAPVGESFRALTELLFTGEGLVRDEAEGGWPVRLKEGEPSLGSEGYVLSWDAGGAQVEASTSSGHLYGLITLGQMLRGARYEPSRFVFPAAGRISDGPGMAWRGCHLDVARRFYSTAEVARFVAILAWNKLNVLHWHLSDDEAFRVEIDAYPELTRIGGWRGHGMAVPPLLGTGPEPAGGIYTKAAVRELITLAERLGVQIVPEVDIPGHCYAMLQALPQLSDPGENGLYHSIQQFPNNCLNPAVEAVYPVLETIFEELFELFPSRFFHVGADEVPEDAWSASPQARALAEQIGVAGAAPLQAHFLRRVHALVTARGKIAGAWEEAAQGGGIAKEDSYLVGWHSVEISRRLAAEGYDVVVAPGQAYYLDMANSRDWYEPGASWAGASSPAETYAFDPTAGWTEAEHQHFMGVQACIWSEPMSDRAVFDRLVFPRLSAIAETGWTIPERKHFPRFAAAANLMPNLYGTAERRDADG